MIIQTRPVYGYNYKLGYICFEYDSTSAVNAGIAWFSRLDEVNAMNWAHVSIVSGPNERIHATGQHGVARGDLQSVFDDPGIVVSFKKPRGWSLDLGARIVLAAQANIGQKYDSSLIAGHAASGSFLGRLLNKLSADKAEEKLCDLFDSPDEWICSELVAFALNEQAEFRGKGVLARPACTITPQELFADDVVFEPWKDTVPPDRFCLKAPDAVPAKVGGKGGAQ